MFKYPFLSKCFALSLWVRIGSITNPSTNFGEKPFGSISCSRDDFSIISNKRKPNFWPNTSSIEGIFLSSHAFTQKVPEGTKTWGGTLSKSRVQSWGSPWIYQILINPTFFAKFRCLGRFCFLEMLSSSWLLFWRALQIYGEYLWLHGNKQDIPDTMALCHSYYHPIMIEKLETWKKRFRVAMMKNRLNRIKKMC